MAENGSDFANVTTSCSMKRLEESVVHKMCAGQIITTLAVAVKELIENSLDAGAKNIEIILKDYGSSVIEVRDNGPGVEKDNRSLFALKHCTSKISDFSDVYKLDTYGFRGEAIHSLCTIGEVSLITRHSDDNYGVLLMFDRSGNINEERPHARMIGTTVFVKNIFSSFPVRRKLLCTNLKKEFSRALDVIRAYCLVSVGTRIVCSHQVGEKSASTVLVSSGTSILDNVCSVFGTDQVKELMQISCCMPDQQILDDFKINEENDEFDVSFDGYVSSCSKGQGRSMRDRQFIYINSRPCDNEAITRLINSIYHQYQKRKYPFLYLNLKLPCDCIDINCSPDKREVIIKNEKFVLATLKASLLGLFDSVLAISTVKIDQLPTLDISSFCEQNSCTNTTAFESEEVGKFCLDGSVQTTANNLNDTLSMDNLVDHKQDKLDHCIELENKISEKPKMFVVDNNIRCCNTERKEWIIDVSPLTEMEDIVNEKSEALSSPDGCIGNNVLQRFKALMDPTQNDNAEKELRQHISGEMFTKMEIIGQLNKSFIIVHLESDLFIIDQHAADEKFNFETLMKSSLVKSQQLAVPEYMEFHPNHEKIISDYLEVFRWNGFEFAINDSGAPSERVALISVPLSKSHTLGKEDVSELIAKLEECPDKLSRPSRIRAMFASRACRKSVMMGSALSESTMRTIVNHMGDLQEPWKCPHGRPTMRHLYNLNKMRENV